MLRIILFFMCLLTYVSASETSVIEVKSKSMQKLVKVSVVLPDSYKESTKKYPVVYLLHGYGNSHEHWPRYVNKLVDEHQIIAICADGNTNSWYFDSPLRKEYRYETFFTQELISHIDANYRTEAVREKRAIAGASMGGHGAMYLALRNKDVYGAAGSMSGGLDIRPFSRRYAISSHLGNISASDNKFEEHTAINNIKRIKNGELALFLDCGTKDFFIDVNRSFVEELKKQGITHIYKEREGSHGWKFWRHSIVLHMQFFNDYFNEKETK